MKLCYISFVTTHPWAVYLVPIKFLGVLAALAGEVLV